MWRCSHSLSPKWVPDEVGPTSRLSTPKHDFSNFKPSILCFTPVKSTGPFSKYTLSYRHNLIAPMWNIAAFLINKEKIEKGSSLMSGKRGFRLRLNRNFGCHSSYVAQKLHFFFQCRQFLLAGVQSKMATNPEGWKMRGMAFHQLKAL